MYDEPPDPEDPPPCPLCEGMTGSTEDCEHCTLVRRHAELESKFGTLKRVVLNAAVTLANAPIYRNGDPAQGISDRHRAATLLLLHWCGLKLSDDDYREAFATAVGEFEWLGYPRPVEVEHALANFRESTTPRAAAGVFPDDVLDLRGRDEKDMLWLLLGLDGSYFVATDAEKMASNGGWTGGQSCPWSNSLRESIASWIHALEGQAAFWCEFLIGYLRPPLELEQGAKVSYVVGEKAYTAYVGTYQSSPYGGTGFGGAPFHVVLDDGRNFFTNNNWSRGTVPPALRSLIPSNAHFEPAKGTTHANG